MSDYADNADSRIYRTIAAGLAAARCARPLLADFHCHFCDEPIEIELLFCDSDCRDDFERHTAAARRAGKQSF
ncbi:hypothetical protein RB25_20560 [Herbaspirillum rubrisubalbicans]|uniref:DUF2116 family Zn-ribbon domain-containing protein n=1 Tax=Herbaspirillum rubrisubalbicans TaxID=80842 RepID=UPI000DC4BBF8|nr:DUF2116 family Zn-ribbon domain-containing protein [Herbaspirillum rubrisubalbicans]RAN44249.1 hypothetical protein RB25_20560 [Herbaspirillum rubrisubalbicans]